MPAIFSPGLNWMPKICYQNQCLYSSFHQPKFEWCIQSHIIFVLYPQQNLHSQCDNNNVLMEPKPEKHNQLYFAVMSHILQRIYLTFHQDKCNVGNFVSTCTSSKCCPVTGTQHILPIKTIRSAVPKKLFSIAASTAVYYSVLSQLQSKRHLLIKLW